MIELTWRDYAKRRTGLPVGSKGELRQNLIRAFTAPSFARFWQIWNPIFGYYLQKMLYRPLQRWLVKPVALVCTFIGNGLLHDAVTMVVRWDVAWFFTPWFALMGLYVVVEGRLRISMQQALPLFRVLYQLTLLALTAGLAWQLRI